MENKELMDKLLQTNPGINHEFQQRKQDSNISNESFNEYNEGGTKKRVDRAKYKLYCITFAIILCLFWMIWIPDIKNKFSATEQAFNNVNMSSLSLSGDITTAENAINELNTIINNENNLTGYLSNKKNLDCSKLPDSWIIDKDSCKTDVAIPLSYLQLTSLYSEKMNVDEKKILRNLKEYLIRDDMGSDQKVENGDILSISIGDPEPTDFNGLLTKINDLKGKYNQRDNQNHFYKVPVRVTISFDKVEDLVTFLYNVEKKIINTDSDRILYKIQRVSYDVVSRDEPQVTDIEMVAYYYYDEKFKEVSDNPEEVNSIENTTEDSIESESFFDGISDTISSRFN